MRILIPLTFAAALAVTPATAAEDDLNEGFDLLSEGTQLLLRGLMSELEPALRDLESTGPILRDLLGEMGPALRELEGAIGGLNAYHAPEILPNGDILIRRKATKAPETLDGQDTDEIEL